MLEELIGMKAKKNYLPLQPGDVPETWADIDDLMKAVDYQPKINIEEGLRRFVEWYREYYGGSVKS